MATPYLLFLTPLFLSVLSAPADELVVTTNYGKVQGKLVPVPGNQVRAFLGIPFAKPPVGELRFRHPVPVDAWDGVKNTSSYGNSCYQSKDERLPGFRGAEMWNPNTPVSEDCLYLNIWTPRITDSSTKLPVMIWIYGGGFFSGTASLDIYDGRHLANKENVILVSMNYRVAAFGFLSLPDSKNILGNAGLMDQRLAIKWTAENIAAFGGDPSKITIFGESAGAGSVGFQLLSPISNIYFQRAIMQSGSPNAQWATQTKDVAWSSALALAEKVGCPKSPTASLEACLQKVAAKDVETQQYNINTKSPLLPFLFVPVEEDGVFLTKPLETLMNSADLLKKDVFFGFTKDEGTYFQFYWLPGFSLTGESPMSRQRFLDGLELVLNSPSKIYKSLTVNKYTDWTNVNNELKNRDMMGRLIGDMMFCRLLEFAQRLTANGVNVYAYMFEHISSTNPWPKWMGVMHGYEIEFVFGMPLNPSMGYTPKEVNMTKRMMSHWGNFAKTGNPSIPEVMWTKFTNENNEYFTLDTNPSQMKPKLKAKDCQYWNSLVPEIKRFSAELESCQNGTGNAKVSNLMFLLISVLLTLTYW